MRGIVRLLIAGSVAVTGLAAQPPVVPGTAATGLVREIPVRLMVLNEVTSRTARVGDRFVLLLDQPLVIDGRLVAPVGTKALGEVTETHRNGSAGTAGRLAAKLLWLDAPGGRLALHGNPGSAGATAMAQMGAAAVVFGVYAPLALLTRGNDGKLKAGEIVTGTLGEAIDALPAAQP